MKPYVGLRRSKKPVPIFIERVKTAVVHTSAPSDRMIEKPGGLPSSVAHRSIKAPKYVHKRIIWQGRGRLKMVVKQRQPRLLQCTFRVSRPGTCGISSKIRKKLAGVQKLAGVSASNWRQESYVVFNVLNMSGIDLPLRVAYTWFTFRKIASAPALSRIRALRRL